MQSKLAQMKDGLCIVKNVPLSSLSLSLSLSLPPSMLEYALRKVGYKFLDQFSSRNSSRTYYASLLTKEKAKSLYDFHITLS